MTCLVEGCTTPAKYICREHWFSLDIKIRRKWWAETDYSKKDPSKELLEEIRNAITIGGQVKEGG